VTKKPDPTKNVLDLVGADRKRADDLMVAAQKALERELHWIDKYNTKCFEYEEKLTQKQSARHDANEELIRVMVNQVADTVKESTDRTVERVSALELSFSQNQGKSALTDPMLTELLAKVELLSKSESTNTGSKMGMRDLIGWLVAVAMMIIAALALILKK
jgi:hypothetical protein